MAGLRSDLMNGGWMEGRYVCSGCCTLAYTYTYININLIYINSICITRSLSKTTTILLEKTKVEQSPISDIAQAHLYIQT